ncbi:MAG TPA: very short patch repair endonuclease [Terriglobia bacterium]|nr:very short patch repair endonuclease [Terriglobia bacterium]
MSDTFDKNTRSWIMSRVQGENTTPELVVQKFLRSLSIRFRSHYKKLPGHPDIVVPSVHLAIFVNGCFWHWHGCSRSRMPKTNVDYWKKKIKRNVLRDRRARRDLRRLGWHYWTIWECSVATSLPRLLGRVKSLQGCSRGAKRTRKVR